MKNKEQWFQLFLGQARTLILYASLVCRIGHGIKSKPPVRTGSIKLNLFRPINLYPFSRKKYAFKRVAEFAPQATTLKTLTPKK